MTIKLCNIASKSEIEFTPELVEIIDTPDSLCSGGLTGAGAKITGAVGDVFAKLTFDEQFQDKRQQQKTRPPKLGSKFGGFAKVHTHTHTHNYILVASTLQRYHKYIHNNYIHRYILISYKRYKSV